MAITKDLRALMLLAGSKAEASEMEQLRGRLTSVARILIEQHADVNATVDGLSILELSCRWKDWETIALLLKHHAHVSPSTLLQFRSLTDQRKFTAMVQSASVESVRPPRLCPCWSGQFVPDCHGQKSIEYPLDYVCVCGTGKTYVNCCRMRGKIVKEK